MTKVRVTGKTLYMLSVGVFFAALLAGEMTIYLSGLSRVSNILSSLTFVLVLGGGVLSLREETYSYPWLYVGFFFVAALFWDLSYVKCSLDLVRNEQINAWSGLVSLNLSLVIWVVNALRGKTRKRGRHQARSGWRRYIPLAVICAVFAALFMFNFDVWFHLDAAQYYSYVAENAGKWNFRFTDMDPLRTCAHTCYAFSPLLTIGQLLAPYLGHGQRAVVLVMSVVAIVAFYLITEKIWGREKWLRSVLLTAIFAFSPTYYGISYLISTDFAMLFYFTLLLLAAFYDITFLKFIAVLGVCFSKENGVFVLAGFYLGEVIASFIKQRKTVGGFFREAFRRKRVAVYSGAFVYAAILFFGSGGWAREFRTALSPVAVEIPEDTYTKWHYPALKLFETFFMNFNWLLWVLLLIACVAVLAHCRREGITVRQYFRGMGAGRGDYYIPILIAFAAFCVAGIAFLTYIHYRYIQLGHLFYVLCLGMVMDAFPGVSLKKELLLVPVLLAMTVQSFITVDPVTYLVLDHVETGKGQIVSTRKCWYIIVDEKTKAGYWWETDKETMSQHYLAEGTEYNREIIGLQRVVENALRDVGYDKDKLVVLDVFGGWESWTCAQLLGAEDGGNWYWDTDAETVVRTKTDVPLNLAFDTQNLKKLMGKFSEVYYIDFPMNPYHENDVLKKYPAKDSFSESYMRWKIDVYRLK